jgi:membrane protein required for colicin V production
MTRARSCARIETDDLNDAAPHGTTAMNSFDIAVCAGLAIAVTTGFNTGLLRSAVTILAYLFATPIAMWVMSAIAPRIGGVVASPLAQNWVLFLVALLAAGMVLGHLARMALNDAIGPDSGIGDRLAGAVLGALRVVMIATTLVLIFDRLVPAERQPPFLKGSRMRPLFSAAGQKGLSSLPPDAAATIDRLKREQRIGP